MQYQLYAQAAIPGSLQEVSLEVEGNYIFGCKQPKERLWSLGSWCLSDSITGDNAGGSSTEVWIVEPRSFDIACLLFTRYFSSQLLLVGSSLRAKIGRNGGKNALALVLSLTRGPEESNHHWRSVSDTRVPRCQLSRDDYLTTSDRLCETHYLRNSKKHCKRDCKRLMRLREAETGGPMAQLVWRWSCQRWQNCRVVVRIPAGPLQESQVRPAERQRAPTKKSLREAETLQARLQKADTPSWSRQSSDQTKRIILFFPSPLGGFRGQAESGARLRIFSWRFCFWSILTLAGPTVSESPSTSHSTRGPVENQITTRQSVSDTRMSRYQLSHEATTDQTKIRNSQQPKTVYPIKQNRYAPRLPQWNKIIWKIACSRRTQDPEKLKTGFAQKGQGLER